MDFKEFTAGKDDDGRRLDRVLRIFLPQLKLNEIYKLIRKGLIKVNQKKAKADTHVMQGDKILIAQFLFNEEQKKPLMQEKALETKPYTLPYKIIFENKNLLIIDKPYGQSVHGSEKNKNSGLDKAVLQYYESIRKDNAQASLSFRPGPLHRLDRNTSGLLVFSMSLEGAQWFSQGIKNHTIQKKYYGLAEGRIEKTEIWEDRLADSTEAEDSFHTFHTVEENDQGQAAFTRAIPLAWGRLENKEVTLVEYDIKTGRKHQIRAQSQIHGHPLAGDKAYGGHSFEKLQREYYLQAFCLKFPDDNPLGLPSEIKMGLSPDFLHLLECCEIKNPGL